MAGRDPAILFPRDGEDKDARAKPAHDDGVVVQDGLRPT